MGDTGVKGPSECPRNRRTQAGVHPVPARVQGGGGLEGEVTQTCHVYRRPGGGEMVGAVSSAGSSSSQPKINNQKP